MKVGTYVELGEGLRGILYEENRGDGKVRVVCDVEEMPEVHSVPMEQIREADGQPSERLLRFYQFSTIVSEKMREPRAETEEVENEGEREFIV